MKNSLMARISSGFALLVEGRDPPAKRDDALFNVALQIKRGAVRPRL